MENGTIINQYKIISAIGKGGMGEVYLAEDTKLERQVALKVLLDEVAGDEERVRRFVQEAKAASALNHPNILTVYEIGEFEHTRYIATELIKGETLRDRLSGRTLNLREVLDIAMQAAAALNAAHSAGIVHRDIKPENIMLRDDGFVKVLDFGLAKLTAAPTGPVESEDATRAQVNTRPGVVMGTVLYMSPEQARGRETDARSDIWSLGVVIYEMLAGRTPFAGETANDSIAAILTREPRPLDEATPAELRRIVRKSLQKETDERYQTVKDLLLDIKHLRRELEFSEELERSQVPQSTVSSDVGAARLDDNATVSHGVRSSGGVQAVSTLQPESQTQSASSAEYLVSQVKEHKKGALVGLGLLVLVIAAVGFGVYKFAGRTETGSIRSIAVLPFQNRSGDPNSEYLSDGLAESLIYRLSQIPELKVSPTSSVIRYKGKDTEVSKIASELGVDAVMTGRLAQIGDDLTISVELVDVRNNKLLWGEQYQRKMSELLATQREIAATITQKLQLKLSGEETGITKKYTNNNEAYQLYLKGRFAWNKRNAESLTQAVKFYKEAIEKDPGFALAYSGLAETYVISQSYLAGTPKETMPQAKAAALRALELDESLAEAHAALGRYLNDYEFDFAGGERELRRAIELNPKYATAHSWLGNILMFQKRFDEAIAECKLARDADPLSLIASAEIANGLTQARRYDEAIAQVNETLKLDPNFFPARFYLGRAYLYKGMPQEAIAEFRQAANPADRRRVMGLLASALIRSGQRAEAMEILDQLKAEAATGNVRPHAFAQIYAALGNKEEALVWMERTVADRWQNAFNFAIFPDFDELRSDPRFSAILKKANLPE